MNLHGRAVHHPASVDWAASEAGTRLRHQLRVIETKVGKPAWQPGDRILLGAPQQAAAQTLPREVGGVPGEAGGGGVATILRSQRIPPAPQRSQAIGNSPESN